MGNFRIINEMKFLLFKFAARGITFISDKYFLELSYEYVLHKKLNFNNLQTFNEKLQWFKLYDRNPRFTDLVDKYKVKEIVADKIGEEYIIKTLGIYNKFNEIDFEKLPNRFVIKTTHDSGGVVVCKDKTTFNFKEAKKKINKSLKRNYYNMWREWPYKNVPHKIIIEEFMQDDNSEFLSDYKLQCFDGKVDNILVCVDRFTETGVKYHYFDTAWNYLPYCPYPGINSENVNIEKPKQLQEMIEIAEKLSKGFAQIRVDLYIVNEHVYFGELTLSSNAGVDDTITEEADMIMGKKTMLRKAKSEEIL